MWVSRLTPPCSRCARSATPVSVIAEHLVPARSQRRGEVVEAPGAVARAGDQDVGGHGRSSCLRRCRVRYLVVTSRECRRAWLAPRCASPGWRRRRRRSRRDVESRRRAARCRGIAGQFVGEHTGVEDRLGATVGADRDTSDGRRRRAGSPAPGPHHGSDVAVDHRVLEARCRCVANQGRDVEPVQVPVARGVATTSSGSAGAFQSASPGSAPGGRFVAPARPS